MKCPYCNEEELQCCILYFCHRCRVAMTELELAIAVRANEDRDMLERLSGRAVQVEE